MTRPPIDTSTLGSVRIDPAVTAARLRIVREALAEVANGETDPRAAACLDGAADLVSEAGLLKLARLLR